MPNWCNTNIQILSSDKEKVKELYIKLMEWTSCNFIENRFGEAWLGNIIGNSGIAEWDGSNFIDKETGKSLFVRGTVEWRQFDGNINLSEDTAWRPAIEMWLMLCEKYLPDFQLFYDAMECGCGVYITNIPTMTDRYILDIFGDAPEGCNFETDWEATEDSVRKFCQETLGTDETDIEKLIDMTEDECDWVSINKWEYKNEYECD